MNRRLFAISTALAASIGLGACGGATPSLPGAMSFGKHHGSGSTPIQHVVMIVQENRSFDNLFATFPGANGAKRGKEKVKKNGKWITKSVTLKAGNLVLPSDITHCHAAFELAFDGGKMDGFNLERKGPCGRGGTIGNSKPAKLYPYQYVQPTQIQPYWDIAQQWVLADAMFQTQGSGSFTAHQDLIRGGTLIDSTESLIDNPSGMPWGCDSSKTSDTNLLTIYGQYEGDAGPFPCSNKFPNYSSNGYQTLRDLLDAHGVSWKYYTPCFMATTDCPGSKKCSDCAGGLLNAFDAIAPVRYGPEWDAAVSMPETNIFTDIQNGTLPNVSWVIPEDANSDHPGDGSVDDGPSWVASVVNAIGQSQYWNSSVIIVLWDDWGGFYDNASPAFLQDNFGGLGFRVPCMIVSPYAIAGSGSQSGYISHTQYEFGSILKYIEQNWNLGSLNTTDKRATSIADVLDYGQSPRQFTSIPSQHDAKYFQAHAGKPQRGDPQ
jgi:phospholipase C